MILSEPPLSFYHHTIAPVSSTDHLTLPLRGAGMRKSVWGGGTFPLHLCFIHHILPPLFSHPHQISKNPCNGLAFSQLASCVLCVRTRILLFCYLDVNVREEIKRLCRAQIRLYPAVSHHAQYVHAFVPLSETHWAFIIIPLKIQAVVSRLAIPFSHEHNEGNSQS